MSLPTIEQLCAQWQASHLRVDWKPKACGNVSFHIDGQGQWQQDGEVIARPELVKLLASVLVKEANHYWLITPAEKVAVTVTDHPFVLTAWQWLDSASGPVMCLTGPLAAGLIHAENPLYFDQREQPYLIVRDGLTAKLSRALYYQLIELALSQVHNQHLADEQLPTLVSAGYHCPLAAE